MSGELCGGGVARQIAQKYPKIEQEYIKFCEKYNFTYENLKGKVDLTEENGKYIANMFSQDAYFNTDYETMREALYKIKEFAKQENLTVAMPYRIGCGIARGFWPAIFNVIDKTFIDYKVTLYKWNENKTDDITETSISNIKRDIEEITNLTDIAEVVLPQYSTENITYKISERQKIAIKNVLNEIKRLRSLDINKLVEDSETEQLIHKDKVREKIKKLENEFDFYAGREHAEWQDGEFDGDICDELVIKIQALKELL